MLLFIEKIEVVKKGKVRRSKLYYIREKTAKQSRLKELKKPITKNLKNLNLKKVEEPVKKVKSKVKKRS